MKERRDIYNMSDRELRRYKWKLRRRREMQKKLATLILTVCLIGVCVFSYHSLKSSANSGTDEMSFKYYTSITVKRGETLWSISDRYIDYSQYKNKSAYIKEVCSINNLDEDAVIRSGQRLVVPYYSSEFVK